MPKRINHLLEFGPYRVDPGHRLLLRGQDPVPLSPKAFDLLLILLERSGEVVSKDELMQLLWPDTFVEESNLGQHVFQLRKALGERPQDHTYIITVPGRGYRFAEQVRPVVEEVRSGALELTNGAQDERLEPGQDRKPEDGKEEEIVVASRSLAQVVIERDRKKDLRFWIMFGAMTAAVIVAAGFYWRSQQKPKLTEKDTIVLADFDNRTGDAVFDTALRQGLSAQLLQSPYLNLLSDQTIAHTLSLMGRPKDAHLTPELAQEVCQRAQSTAVLASSIAQIGEGYLLTLKAVACSNGELLASTEAEARDKNHVLDAMGKTASEIRGKLGESLASVQKYDVPPEDVSTPSLEALRIYSLAHQAQRASRAAESVELFKKSIELDPNFAMANLGLGINYFNLDETALADVYVQKAYELRQPTSEREKLQIEMIYQPVVMRNFEAAREAGLMVIQLYPRDWSTFVNMSVAVGYLGDYEEALAYDQKALAAAPGNLQLYTNLITGCLQLDHLEQADAAAREAAQHNFDSPFLHVLLYQVDFLKHDPVAMEHEAAQVVGKPGFEDLIYYYESDTAAYRGEFAKARELTRRAAESALRQKQKETMAEYESEAAVREALIGNFPLANSQARNALAASDGRYVAALSAIALALAGDPLAARLSDDLSRRFPEDTPLKYNLLPSVQAAAALHRGDSSRAIEALASTRYEIGQTVQAATFVLYPAYLRGEAYLAARQGAAAAAEFQKIFDHPGLVQNEPIAALAHLEMGRAYVQSHDLTKAKSEYRNFLSLWKDADAGLPILKQAKTEYAKLQ